MQVVCWSSLCWEKEGGWPGEPQAEGRASQGSEHGHEHCCMHQ